MDPECIRKCMSLGYSSKMVNKTIGQYGNGFKTSTMRLGADVIVFTRASKTDRTTQSVGLLSYSFLRRTGHDDVIVPMVDFDISDHWAEPIIYSSKDDWSTNLKTILEWSPFQSKDELMLQFEDIGQHGTKIIIYNLWLNDEGIYELNFDDDEEDVRLRDEANRGIYKLNKRAALLQSHISYSIRFSLRAYASILYLRKFINFQIILRGKPVEQFNIADELIYPKVITYRPQLGTTMKEVTVETTIGFIKEAPAIEVSGFNVYNRNRLIRPFWKVINSTGSQGNGVIGILEANFIEPAHDKQDFERSSVFIRLEARLKQMVSDYWRGHCHLVGYQPVDSILRRAMKESPAQPPPGHMASTQKQMQIGRHVVGLPANEQGVDLGQSVIGLAANSGKNLSGAQIGIECRSSNHGGWPDVHQPSGNASESSAEVPSLDSPISRSIDEICEENIQLFLRHEEHRHKENELKQTIEDLQKKLEETKRKCAELCAYLESRRKQKIMQQVEKV